MHREVSWRFLVLRLDSAFDVIVCSESLHELAMPGQLRFTVISYFCDFYRKFTSFQFQYNPHLLSVDTV